MATVISSGGGVVTVATGAPIERPESWASVRKVALVTTLLGWLLVIPLYIAAVCVPSLGGLVITGYFVGLIVILVCCSIIYHRIAALTRPKGEMVQSLVMNAAGGTAHGIDSKTSSTRKSIKSINDAILAFTILFAITTVVSLGIGLNDSYGASSLYLDYYGYYSDVYDYYGYYNYYSYYTSDSSFFTDARKFTVTCNNSYALDAPTLLVSDSGISGENYRGCLRVYTDLGAPLPALDPFKYPYVFNTTTMSYTFPTIPRDSPLYRTDAFNPYVYHIPYFLGGVGEPPYWICPSGSFNGASRVDLYNTIIGLYKKYNNTLLYDVIGPCTVEPVSASSSGIADVGGFAVGLIGFIFLLIDIILTTVLAAKNLSKIMVGVNDDSETPVMAGTTTTTSTTAYTHAPPGSAVPLVTHHANPSANVITYTQQQQHPGGYVVQQPGGYVVQTGGYMVQQQPTSYVVQQPGGYVVQQGGYVVQQPPSYTQYPQPPQQFNHPNTPVK